MTTIVVFFFFLQNYMYSTLWNHVIALDKLKNALGSWNCCWQWNPRFPSSRRTAPWHRFSCLVTIQLIFPSSLTQGLKKHQILIYRYWPLVFHITLQDFMFNSVVFLWIFRCIASCVAVCIIIALMLQVFNFCVIFAAVSVEFQLSCTHFTEWQAHVICWMCLYLAHHFLSLPSIALMLVMNFPVF